MKLEFKKKQKPTMEKHLSNTITQRSLKNSEKTQTTTFLHYTLKLESHSTQEKSPGQSPNETVKTLKINKPTRPDNINNRANKNLPKKLIYKLHI